MGALFEVHREWGYGYREVQYHKAIEFALNERKIQYQREVPIPITFKNQRVTTNYLDFLIEGKIILEIKQGKYFSKSDIEQLYNYLRATNLQLGILARFTKEEVRSRRVVHLS